MIQRGARLVLEVEKAAAGGRMLARHAGQVVLVANAIPGERVRARVERVGKGVAFADVEEVLTASPDRRPGAADWRCGGTVYSHIAYPRQRQLKGDIIRDAFLRIARLPLAGAVDVLGSPEAGYRMRARLHVSGGRIGFFREGTHELCDPGATDQLLPATLEWIAAASRSLSDMATGTPTSGVIAVEISESVDGQQRAAHLELEAGADASAFRALAEGLVGLSGQAEGARRRTVLAGVPAIRDAVAIAGSPSGPLTLVRDVRAFFQGNRFLLEPLVTRVVALVGREGPTVDLYAGVGLFGLAAATAGTARVVLVEGDPISSADLARNAEPFGPRAQVFRQSVETFLSRARTGSADAPAHVLDPSATFIVDPPRTGMTRDALAGIIAHQPHRVVYVSCDVATLARDARTLIDAGWELAEVSGLDLFPNTAHVETVAMFRR